MTHKVRAGGDDTLFSGLALVLMAGLAVHSLCTRSRPRASVGPPQLLEPLGRTRGAPMRLRWRPDPEGAWQRVIVMDSEGRRALDRPVPAGAGCLEDPALAHLPADHYRWCVLGGDADAAHREGSRMGRFVVEPVTPR